MVFSNLTFVCLFLPITLALYFSSPKRLHNTVLVLASIVLSSGPVGSRSFSF